MDDLIFEWDENKNLSNQKKHGISFKEAQEVFYDDDAILFDDPDNSEYEDRFLLIGMTQKERLCIVSHCYRGDDNIIRIISARKAVTSEIQVYNEYRGGEL